MIVRLYNKGLRNEEENTNKINTKRQVTRNEAIITNFSTKRKLSSDYKNKQKRFQEINEYLENTRTS